MKIVSRIILIAIFFQLFLGMTANVSALENNDYVGVSPNIPEYSGEMSTYGTSKPSNLWDWSKGSYYMSGSTSNTNLYSNYLFTGMSSLTINFSRADEAITLELWKRNTGLFQSDKKIDSITVKRLTAEDVSNKIIRTVKLSGATTSGKYYIKILAPAHFVAKISLN